MVDGMKEKRKYREILVYGKEVEGVKMSLGEVESGGLRWQDREKDYRKEVMGIVKEKKVKNEVIVKVGEKGGLYKKRMKVGGERNEVFEEGRDEYNVFI